MASGDGQPRIYSLSTETASGSVENRVLSDELDADATISPKTVDHGAGGIGTDGDVLTIFFSATLDAGELTAADAVVLAHSPPAAYRALGGPVHILADEALAFTLGTTWEEAGAAVLCADDFFVDLTKVAIRVCGVYNTNGTQADVRLLEDGVEKGTYALPDSSSADAVFDETFEFTAASGDQIYQLEARQGTATALALGSCTMTLRLRTN